MCICSSHLFVLSRKYELAGQDDDIWMGNVAPLVLHKTIGRLLTTPAPLSRLSAALTDISLADVRFFRRACIVRSHKDDEGNFLSSGTFFGIEVVSLCAWIVLGYLADESHCERAAKMIFIFIP